VVIKVSSRTQIDALITDLGSERPITRESAITCLIVIGGRALERVMSLADDRSASSTTRTAALRVLEAIANPRSLDVILRAIDDLDTNVATAAAGAARAFLRGARGAAAVDRLTTAALNRQRAESIRVAALGSLSELGPSTLKPVHEALVNDPSAAIAALVSQSSVTDPEASNAAWLRSAAEGELPDEPDTVRRTIAMAGNTAPLPLLHRLIERLRERERIAPAERRMEWMTARGAAHAALAGRGSRLALYDLRETFEASSVPLPVEFVSALQEIGDTQCLEPIAVAYSKTKDEWWRNQLADAFRLIVSRERVTARHAIMKRIGKRWSPILGEHQGGKGGRGGKGR
jgi:HEAT repeat protein